MLQQVHEPFEYLELHIQTLSVEDFKIFRDLPIKEKYLFSPYLDPSFGPSDLEALQNYYKGDKNSFLQLRVTKLADLNKFLSF
jgi:hypothetical protein